MLVDKALMSGELVRRTEQLVGVSSLGLVSMFKLYSTTLAQSLKAVQLLTDRPSVLADGDQILA
jgi:hypothetical protein